MNAAVSQQQGYTLSTHKTLLHSDNQDRALVFEVNSFCAVIVADGHAGSDAPAFFTLRMHQRLQTFLANDWDYSQRQEISTRLTSMFHHLDAEYIDLKKREYAEWFAEGCPAQNKPCDDGCTFIVNIWHPDGWMVNCNVGDSRTIVFNDTQVVFSSQDHNMSHAAKVHDINSRGGRFLNPFNMTLLHPSTCPAEERNNLPYNELAYTRLYRENSAQVKEVGCSHRRTLNLSGAMGDLLFKIEPAVLVATPDISFIKLSPQDHTLLVATDGLWDHLAATCPEQQNIRIMEFCNHNEDDQISLDSADIPNLAPDSAHSDTSSHSETKMSMQKTCDTLCERDPNQQCNSRARELFRIPEACARFDDCTVVMAKLPF